MQQTIQQRDTEKRSHIPDVYQLTLYYGRVSNYIMSHIVYFYWNLFILNHHHIYALHALHGLLLFSSKRSERISTSGKVFNASSAHRCRETHRGNEVYFFGKVSSHVPNKNLFLENVI